MTGESESYLVRVSRPAMACEFEICLRAGQYPHGTETALDGPRPGRALEAQLSVFRGDSELARINATAARGRWKSSRGCSRCWSWPCGFAPRRGGAYDITAGPLWEAWGFARRAGGRSRSRSNWPRPAGTSAATWSSWTRRQKTIRFLDPGVQAQPGQHRQGLCRGSLRRTAARRAASRISSSRAATAASWPTAPPRRRRPTPAAGHRRPLAGRRPQSPPPRPAADRAAAERPGPGHLGDAVPVVPAPRTPLRPHPRSPHRLAGRGRASATALAPTAALADALSTAFYVLGPEAALRLLPPASGHCRRDGLPRRRRRRPGNPLRRTGRRKKGEAANHREIARRVSPEFAWAVYPP